MPPRLTRHYDGLRSPIRGFDSWPDSLPARLRAQRRSPWADANYTPTLAAIADSEYLLGIVELYQSRPPKAAGPDGAQIGSLSRSEWASSIRVLAQELLARR
jgi:hypothetical protein